MAALLTPGMRFRVTEVSEFVVGVRRIARYRPEFEYSVTDLNTGFVSGLVAQGRAAVTGYAPPRSPAGAITVKPR